MEMTFNTNITYAYYFAVVFEDFIFDGSGQSVFFSASAIANGDSACLDIPIQDDSDVEDDQQFQLEIVNASPGIITSPSVTTVTITDNAGYSTKSSGHCSCVLYYS